MAGKIVASTINDDTGVLATQNGMTGIAKAWAQVTLAGAINSSFNVSSVTKGSAGNYTINFTTAMPNATYAFNMSVKGAAGRILWSGSPTTTALPLVIANTAQTETDTDFSVSVFSS
jgi:hypothetical protein